jgi:hypothetical protein
MPWIPADECETCGSTDIRELADEDPSVGYYGSTFACLNGHECSIWERPGKEIQLKH